MKDDWSAVNDEERALYEFKRWEWRCSRFRRHLDCGHKIDHGETYSYFVGKVAGLPGLQQIRLCRYCS